MEKSIDQFLSTPVLSQTKTIRSVGYTIEMEKFYEYYSIFYSEDNDGMQPRELNAEIEFVKDIFYYLPFFRTNVILRVDSFKNWNRTQDELSLSDFVVAMRRIYNFLENDGYRIRLE